MSISPEDQQTLNRIERCMAIVVREMRLLGNQKAMPWFVRLKAERKKLLDTAEITEDELQAAIDRVSL